MVALEVRIIAVRWSKQKKNIAHRRQALLGVLVSVAQEKHAMQSAFHLMTQLAKRHESSCNIQHFAVREKAIKERAIRGDIRLLGWGGWAAICTRPG